MEYDLVIVGAGPAGCQQLYIFKKSFGKKNNKDFSVCIVEKGSEVGSHILSGAILENRLHFNELIEEWEKDDNCPVKTAVTKKQVNFLTDTSTYSIPKFFLPPAMHNNGNYIISLGSFCKWLSSEAEKVGVEIYPGFAASDIIFKENSLKELSPVI